MQGLIYTMYGSGLLLLISPALKSWVMLAAGVVYAVTVVALIIGLKLGLFA